MPDGQPEARTTVGAARDAARRRLRAAGVAEADLDARRLAEHAFDADAAFFAIQRDATASPDALARLEAMLGRRAGGEPVGRIVGRRSFHAHEFALGPDTLEPRPDTETLVDLAAETLLAKGERPLLAADLGTGSGAIAVSLLALVPELRCLAIDIAPGALALARRNAEAAGVGARFLPLRCDYLSAVRGPFDLVVSNPPYIPTGEIATLSREVREHDPLLALDGGADGLTAYRRIAAEAGGALGTDGDVAVEIGAGQSADVRRIFADAGFALAGARCDLGGHERALWFRRDISRR